MDPCQAMQKTIVGKFSPSKSSAAATTTISSRTRPKQSIPEGKPLCNPTSGGDADGGPITHQQNQSGTGRGNLFPFERRSVPPPYRPHDQQRQPLFDFPPAISPASAVPGGPGGRTTITLAKRRSKRRGKRQQYWRNKRRRYLEDLRPWMFNTNWRNGPAPCPRTPRAERGKYQLKHRISKPRLYFYLPTATRRIPTKRRAGAHPDFRAGQFHHPIGHLRWRESPHTVDVPICQLLADFCASLLRRMQSVFLNPCHATLRPGLEDLISTALIALIGLKTILQPL
jgi:hypothetical protein